ncbi:hypothetical protein C2G38_2216129 [Gigaspora rosea]|uniref:Pre-mRNA polyadenylation factor Fip1 domain-containing protein n=1 Tax=Gigaspora rosea TaxID=44941 RepID=A0A397UI35_9GLOM|nr:hypothetical protein C2G38_2216129 [Gigaspora rosea]
MTTISAMANALENEFQQVNKRQVAFSQQWDLAEFLETMELDEHKNRYVAGNHWGMFVLVEEDFSELDRFINQAKKVGVDINAVGSLDGTSIYDVDLDSVEVKLWRKPEADITDYFNSGFNEYT